MKNSQQPGCQAARRASLYKVAALVGGVLAAPIAAAARLASPDTIPQGIVSWRGEVSVAGKPAESGQDIGPAQLLQTGHGSTVTFVIGETACTLRENSSFMLMPFESRVLFQCLEGGLLLASRAERQHIDTPTARITVEGAHCYIEATPPRTYFCLCKGRAQLAPKTDPNRRTALRTQDHEIAVFIDRVAGARAVLSAPQLGHADSELAKLADILRMRSPPR